MLIWGGRLFEAGRLLNFHHFQQVKYVYFATKQWMLITKREEVTRQAFCKILWRKLRPRESLLLEFIHSSGWGGGGRLFEAGPLVTFSAFRMGAYSNKYGMSFESFCQPACFFAARFTLRQPKTPVGNATNLRTFCFEDYHYAFQETLCPVALARS